jgi:NADPH2:quinone reductase
MKAWRVHAYGAPGEALRLDELAEPVPGSGEVRIRVAAAALNRNDADMCRGRYPTIHPPLPFGLGMEVTGTVDAAAPGLEDWLGRRVAAVPSGGFGGYASRALARVDMVFPVPESLAAADAAALLIPFHTAHLALHRRAGLRAGETLLVHSAAGGVGSAALQLGVAAGARVVATAGGPEKVGLCRELGADLAIDYREQDFVEAVLAATGGRGADVVCDLVGGEVALRSFDCIAREGRYLIAGFSGGVEAGEIGLPPRRASLGNFSLVGVMMAWVSELDPALRRAGFQPFSREVGEEVHRDVLALLEAGRIRPVVGRTIDFEDVPRGLEDLESRRTLGRVVVRVP